jgi:precorrin-6A/cobalt-precorrin-6A reductase
MKRLLILGGTSDARVLAGLVAQDDRFEPVLSLAGRTAQPLEQGVPTRSGGFGGIDGLADYLTATGTDLMIDATHPYAHQMSRHAQAAARAASVPCLHLCRPPWSKTADENWLNVPDISSAVAALPTGARAFTATGRGSLSAFVLRTDIYTLLRVIDPPTEPYAGNGEYIVARPPFSVEAEVAELRRHRATHLVVKNAGGAAARTKLTAAAQLGLPIVIVARSDLPEGTEIVETVAQAVLWLGERA